MALPNIKSLSELSERQATGEFIVVSGDIEVHFFFQCGRVAWGTNSVHRHAFSRHLSHSCDLDKETFYELLEICQQEKTPLGEMLIKSGIATLEDVQEALASQLLETLRCVTEIQDAQTVFLPRTSYSDYDSNLTFSLETLLARVSELAGDDSVAPSAVRGPGIDAHALFDELQAQVPDALWMELVTNATTTSIPTGHTHGVGQMLAPMLLANGADFAAMCSPRGLVLGGATTGTDTSLWVGLGEGATIGNTLAVLAPAFSAHLSADLSGAAIDHSQSPWATRGADTTTLARVRAAVEETDEVLAAFTLDGNGGLLWACTRESLEIADLVENARKRSHAFALKLLDRTVTSEFPSAECARGIVGRSMVIADPTAWTYGCSKGYGVPGSLWLCIDRSTSQGLGWAIQASLARIAFPPEVSP